MRGFGVIVGILCAVVAGAQTLKTVAPERATVGRAFNVEYRIDVANGRIETPDFQNFMVVGTGQITINDSAIFTYTLIARETGRFTIPAARVLAGGRTFESRAATVEVVEGEVEQAPVADRQTGEDIFLRAVTDKRMAWKGESVRVIFKLYSQNPHLRSEGVKMPALNGFWSERMNIEGYEPQTESYNSKTYYTFVVGEYLLFPLQSGTLTIDPLQMNLVVQSIDQSRARSLEDMLFGAADTRETRRAVSSPTVNITVKELPEGAPVGFSGAVGTFTLDAVPPAAQLQANAGAAYQLTIAGTGNFRQITAPEVTMPASFEALNVKTIDDTHTSPRGMTGSKQFEYPIVARGAGGYVIEPVKFVFFNPQTDQYQTVTAPEVRLEILADSLSAGAAQVVGGVSQKDLEVLNQDVRFITRGAPGLHPQRRVFVLSAGWFAIVAALVGLFFAALIFLRKFLEQRADAIFMRGRRADKVVGTRLKAATGYLETGNDRRFNDEMLRALWGYMGDKLNIPAANLTKENIREQLARRDVPNELITKYIEVISECESAQYSPAESAPPHDIYRAAAAIIAKIERYFR